VLKEGKIQKLTDEVFVNAIRQRNPYSSKSNLSATTAAKTG
jgi:hypothetical protein